MNEDTTQEKITAIPESERELVATAGRIREWQKSRRPQMSDTQICRKFPALGSTKTYQKIREGSLDELDINTWLLSYQSVEALIGSGAEDRKPEILFDDLTPVLRLRRAMPGLMRQTSPARLVLLLGDSGSGKSKALECVAAQYPAKRIILIEALEIWNDAPSSFVGAILRALGVTELPYRAEDRFQRLLDKVPGEQRVCFAIDEGHHLGLRCLNTLKNVMNTLKHCEVIIAAKNTLWNRMERASWDDVKQLTKNRLYERIVLANITKSDVAKMVERRLESLAAADREKAVEMLAGKAASAGNLGFIRDVFQHIDENADTKSLTVETLADAIVQTINKK